MREIRTSGSVGASGAIPEATRPHLADPKHPAEESRRRGMERRTKVELFEEIRREYEFGIGTVRGVAQKLGVHRRMVRQALADARPPERKRAQRRRPVAACVMPFIESILESD